MDEKLLEKHLNLCLTAKIASYVKIVIRNVNINSVDFQTKTSN